MDEKLRQIYRRGDLSDYSLKQRLMIRLADLLFFLLIGSIGKTLRFETVGAEHLANIEQRSQVPIYAVWHERIFLTTYFLRQRRIVALVSRSFDGEYIARFLTRFGFGAVRGSSSRGGVGALIELVRLMKQNIPTKFAVDGPKGPPQTVKSGACLLAKKTGQPILPFSVEVSKFWTVKSWDKLRIPKPFSRAQISYSEPLYVEPTADAREIEKKRRELQLKLDELTELGKVWRESNKN